MKILIICNCASGLYLFRSSLIEALIKRGNDICAVIPKTKDKNEVCFEKELKQIGCRLIHLEIDRRGKNPVKDLALLNGYIKLLNDERYDMVITYTIKPNIYGGIACQFTKVPYVVNITGLGTAFENKGVVKAGVCMLYKIALRKAKIVFFENCENRDIIVGHGIVKNEITRVLPGAGVDLGRFSYINYPNNGDEIRFLFIGRVMKEKGIEELIAAMRLLKRDGKDCYLDIVGSLEEDYANELNICEKEGWLKYHGVQSDVRPFIKNSHCFVLPSWHEGMANTNLENAACGRPVITSNIHGCLEAVENGITGYLCEKQNHKELYFAMKRFAELPYEKREAMGLAGRRRMELLFNKCDVVRNTIDEMIDDNNMLR